jgi:galactokinase
MQITSIFEDQFGYRPEETTFTPGRANLIGEHIDYNGGLVLPFALHLGISASFTPRNDRRVRLYSDKFDVMADRTIDDIATDDWSDYALGSVIYANKAGFIKGGADIAISTTLPFGAGLSSSAALTVGLLKLARQSGGANMSDINISLLAREIETEFIGMPCGIMDQMAVSIASPGQALALDTKALNFERIDLPAGYHMAVIHSGQYRRLAEGHYKIRKEECDTIKAYLGRDDICLMTDVEFESLSKLDDTLRRRARHCVTEHQRVKASIDAIRSDDVNDLGRLLNESHISMRDDFEMSLPIIDALVEDAVKFGAIGARLTGGGFGGCIIACVAKDKLEPWTEKLLSSHPAAFRVA